MHTFRKLIAAAALAVLAAGSASAHGSFYGGGGGGHGHGYGWAHGHGHHYFGDYGYYALPSYGEPSCGEGQHFGRDGRCRPDE